MNCVSLAHEDPTSFAWHHTRDNETVDVRADQQPDRISDPHTTAMVIGYFTPSCSPSEPDELRVLLVKQHSLSPAAVYAFPSGNVAAAENIVDAATRGFQDACGVTLSPAAKAHLALNHWRLLRLSPDLLDAHSWIL